MRTRLLPPEEWPRLAGTELETVWPHLSGASAQVIVVEDELGNICACWCAFTSVHVEGLWIAPAHRLRASVARRLWQAMRRHVFSLGSGAVMTAALSDDVRELLETAGATKLPGDHYVLPMGERRCQRL